MSDLFCLGCHVGWFVFLRWLCLETRGIFENSAAVAWRHGESPSLICGRLVLFQDGKRRYAAGSATFTESLDGFSQPVLRRESSGPSGSSLRELEGELREQEESVLHTGALLLNSPI